MNLFSFIKERISIMTVIGEYVTLKKAGSYYKAACPFHHEKTASFTVSPDKEIFYCFGCHESGDVISFFAKIENCTQKDAALLLAQQYSLTIPPTLSYQVTEKHYEQKNHYFSVCKAVAVWCHAQLLKNSAVQTYFYRRGFSKESFTYFTLGYFPGSTATIQDLLHAMKKESILVQDLIDSHIIEQSRSTLYSPFQDRVIFPIKDTLGRFCGFGGRIFKEHDTRPKYYNSRENDFFVKGSLLFGLDKAKKSIQETGSIFLVEGYTDCMAMVEHGIANTVATLGTACTLEHLKQLARYAAYLYIVYDNDTAGNQAVLRLTQLCWQVNLELKVITLPAGHDPASFLACGADIRSLIQTAQDIFLFFISQVGDNFSTKPLNQKMHIIRNVLTIIAPITDLLKKDILLQKCAKMFDIPFDSLKQEMGRLDIPASESVPTDQGLNQTNQPPDSPSALEKQIFCAIINNISLLNGKNCRQLVKYLSSSVRNIIEKLQKETMIHSAITFGSFFDSLDEAEKKYVSKLLVEHCETLDISSFEKLLMRLQKKQWKIIVQDIKAQLAQAKQENNVSEVSRILTDFVELQRTFYSTYTTKQEEMNELDYLEG